MKALLFLLLAACGPATTQTALQVQATGGRLAYGAPVIEAARISFFGPDDETTGSGSGSGSGESTSILNTTDPVNLRGAPPTVTSVSITRSTPLSQSVTLQTTATAAHHHLRGTLPQGLGILTDPLQLNIWAQSLALQATLSHTRPLPANLQMTYGAGLGFTYLSAGTHLQSSLLDVRGRAAQTLPYAVAETRIATPSGAAILGTLQVYQSGATELRLGLEQAF